MSTTLTEVAANADFTTGLTVPQGGVDNFATASTIIKDQSLQETADRCQALAKMVGLNGSNTATLQARLNATSVGSRWNLQVGTTNLYYLQTSVTDAGALWFSLDTLPVGAKLLTVSVRLAGGAPFTAPYTHAGLPGTMPTITVYRQTDGTATSVSSATDSSANVAAYDAFHAISASPNHTIVAGAQYHVKVTGEAGANSNASVLSLTAVTFGLGFS